MHTSYIHGRYPGKMYKLPEIAPSYHLKYYLQIKTKLRCWMEGVRKAIHW